MTIWALHSYSNGNGIVGLGVCVLGGAVVSEWVSEWMSEWFNEWMSIHM